MTDIISYLLNFTNIYKFIFLVLYVLNRSLSALITHYHKIFFAIDIIVLVAVFIMISISVRNLIEVNAHKVKSKETKRKIKQSILKQVDGGVKGELKLKRLLSYLDLPIMTNVYLKNGNKITEIDAIIKLPNYIAVIEVKNWTGVLKGEIQDTHWILTNRNKDKLRRNPIIQNHRHASAILSNSIGNTKIKDVVVFTGNTKFANKMPKNIFLYNQFKGFLKKQSALTNRNPEAKKDIDQTWEHIKGIQNDECVYTQMKETHTNSYLTLQTKNVNKAHNKDYIKHVRKEFKIKQRLSVQITLLVVAFTLSIVLGVA